MGRKYFANLLLGVLIADKMLDNYLQIYMSFFQHWFIIPVPTGLSFLLVSSDIDARSFFKTLTIFYLDG